MSPLIYQIMDLLKKFFNRKNKFYRNFPVISCETLNPLNGVPTTKYIPKLYLPKPNLLQPCSRQVPDITPPYPGELPTEGPLPEMPIINEPEVVIVDDIDEYLLHFPIPHLLNPLDPEELYINADESEEDLQEEDYLPREEDLPAETMHDLVLAFIERASQVVPDSYFDRCDSDEEPRLVIDENFLEANNEEIPEEELYQDFD